MLAQNRTSKNTENANRCVKYLYNMAGQGILIIIIPNDLNNKDENVPVDVAKVNTSIRVVFILNRNVCS